MCVSVFALTMGVSDQLFSLWSVKTVFTVCHLAVSLGVAAGCVGEAGGK